MTVRYEELIKNPDEEVSKIMKFVLDSESFSDDEIKHDIKTTGFVTGMKFYQIMK